MLGKLLDRFLRPAPPTDEFAVLKQRDEAVVAATAEARATLDVFWRKFETGEADQYQLKVGLTTPNEAIEHIWLSPSDRRDGKVVGRLMNQPVDLEDVNVGDEIVVEPQRISDWGYFKDGRLYGAFTQRALLDTLSPAMRRQVGAALAPTPLEPESD
jgi:uncharacterized protein YegJ (DUF2314 family)